MIAPTVPIVAGSDRVAIQCSGTKASRPHCGRLRASVWESSDKSSGRRNGTFRIGTAANILEEECKMPGKPEPVRKGPRKPPRI